MFTNWKFEEENIALLRRWLWRLPLENDSLWCTVIIRIEAYIQMVRIQTQNVYVDGEIAQFSPLILVYYVKRGRGINISFIPSFVV